MSLSLADKARINQMVEESKDDRTIIVGSDIREMSMFIQKLEQENEKLEKEKQALQRCLQTQEAFSHAQRHHAELCNKVFEAAKKAKLCFNVGACGNGGIPTFGAICQKIEEACENIASKSTR